MIFHNFHNLLISLCFIPFQHDGINIDLDILVVAFFLCYGKDEMKNRKKETWDGKHS